MHRFTRTLWALCASVLLLFPGAAHGERAARVVASIPPLHSLVAGVMAGVGQPELVVRGARSPHSYQLAPSAAALLAGADLIVWVGASLEPFLRKPLANLGASARVVALLEVPGLTRYPARAGGVWRRHAPRHRARAVDPHAWLDPENARRLVDEIVRQLSDLDPGHARRYRANGQSLGERLRRLDRALSLRLAPVREMPFAVLHDAFQYLERRYGLFALGAAAAGPHQPPGLRRIRALRAAMAARRARCLFHEPRLESGLAATLVEGTPVERAALDPLGFAFRPGTDAYFQMMTANATAIADCLSR